MKVSFVITNSIVFCDRRRRTEARLCWWPGFPVHSGAFTLLRFVRGKEMRKTVILGIALLLLPRLTTSAPEATAAVVLMTQASGMSFFITSSGGGNGADLGGLAGADARCEMLARSVGAGDNTWRAYLGVAAANGQPAVDARDRIGIGPWRNFRGVVVATDVDNLHGDNNMTKETVLTENGDMVKGRGDTPNRHDILTGVQTDGILLADGEDHTCSNWTSRGDGSALVGHFDRIGGGDNPTSWNSAHGSRGCGQEDLQGTGGDGLFYCFAID